MKRQYPNGKPVDITENCWFYENRGSVDLIVQIRHKDGSYFRTDHIRVPFRKLAKSRCLIAWMENRRPK